MTAAGLGRICWVFLPRGSHMADKPEDDALAQAKRIMRNLTRLPHQPHKPPAAPKGKTRPASKGRVRKGRSRA